MKKYDSYKDSGVEWIGEIPSNWEKKRLKHISKSVNGFSFKSDDFDKDYDVPVIRIGDVGDNINFKRCVKVKSKFLQEREDVLIKRDDILIGLTGGTIGKSGRYNYDNPSLLNQRVGLLRNKESVLNGLLYHYVKSEVFIRYIFFDCYGGGQDNISMGDILNMIFPYPPHSEQQQIVSFLDTKTSLIDTLIEKTQRKIELLKEQRTSLINHTVTKGLNPNVEMKDSGVEWIGEIPRQWKHSKIVYYLRGIKDGTHGSFTTVDNGLPLLSAKNIQKNQLQITDDERLISIEDYQSIVKNGYPQKGDVILVVVGATIGKCTLYELEYSHAFQRSVGFLRPKISLISEFLKYVVEGDLFQSQLKVHTNVAAIGGVYLGEIKNIRISIPPTHEQQQIVEFLDKKTTLIDTTISTEQKRIELLKEYRQSLISNVVTGKIKVTTDD